MKKLLSVLVAVMMLSFVSVLAVRAAETPADVFAYSRVQVVNAAGQTVEGISIDGFRGAGQRDIVIPSQIENLPVLKIGYRAFNESYILNSAVLPEGLLEIDPYAFHECEVLRDVNIPSTVLRIGNSAFDECKMVRAFTIPQGLTVLEPEVFSDCDSLGSVVIPAKVTRIERKAFDGCNSLASVTIPAGVTSPSTPTNAPAPSKFPRR